MEEEEFKTIIKKAKGPHNHKVKNSLGVYDAHTDSRLWCR